MARQTAGQTPANNAVRRPPAGPRGAAAAPQVEQYLPRIKGEGTWKAGIGSYEVAVQDGAGKPISLIGRVEEDELTLASGDMILVFQRAF